MRKITHGQFAASLLKAFEKVPMTRSAAITQAVINAGRDPELLISAFRLRLSQPYEENDTEVTYSRDHRIEAIVKKLAEMTKLSGEQVVRLCMEAYIHRL